MGFSPSQPLLEGEARERDAWWGTMWPLSPLPLGDSPRLPPPPQRGVALSSEPSPLSWLGWRCKGTPLPMAVGVG